MLVDNAGNGQRGLRATPSPELFEALYKYYLIETGKDAVDLGGSSSLNLLAADNHRRYIIRVYRPYVTEARLGLIHLVRHRLTAHGLPCSKIIASQDGHPWIRFSGRLVEVEEYVDHDGKMDSWERLKAGLPLLGRIHTILRNIEDGGDARKPLFANSIEPFDALPRTLKGTQRIRAWNPSPEERQLAHTAEELAHLVGRAEQDLVTLLPGQLVHGDFWDNNVLFQDGQVVLLADFDFMGERARIDDLALTLYFALTSFTSLDEAVANDQLWKLRELVDAYDSGLDNPLTTAERAALPLAIARQPLWSIGGWVVLLDNEASARRHAAAMNREVEFALHIVHEVDRWQTAFV